MSTENLCDLFHQAVGMNGSQGQLPKPDVVQPDSEGVAAAGLQAASPVEPIQVEAMPVSPSTNLSPQQFYLEMLALGIVLPNESAIKVAGASPYQKLDKSFRLDELGVPRIVETDQELTLPCGCAINSEKGVWWAGTCQYCRLDRCNQHLKPCAICSALCCFSCPWVPYHHGEQQYIHDWHLGWTHPFRTMSNYVYRMRR